MKQSNQHLITVKIAGAEPFKLPVAESEESFYRYVIDRINENLQKFRYGANADTENIALAKVALYYATMLYQKTELIRSQSGMLDEFEARIDRLLAGTD
ncbi:MAG: cell division protein ZapA [Muribaculaceae bacterium]|nr:cell division protein ZapA [Muribaculaceae bacterium]